MLYRFPVSGQEIKNGAQLIVRESQTAVFVHGGQIADVSRPAHTRLTAAIRPSCRNSARGNSDLTRRSKPVYFVNTKQFTDLKWGRRIP
jgi:membrane protease subunit (stomatin/prohibitin family)